MLDDLAALDDAIARPRPDRVDLVAARLTALPRAEGHDEYIALAERDYELWNEVADRHPRLHARLSVPPRHARLRRTQVVSYRRVRGRWTADRVKINGRRHARRARRVHPAAEVIDTAACRRGSVLRGRERRTRPRGRRQRCVARATASADPPRPAAERPGPAAAPAEVVA
jgi:hypothetical protein